MLHWRPGSQQITWEAILVFILNRFVIYHNQKAHHPQWDPAGKELFELAGLAHQDPQHFIEAVGRSFSINPPAI